MLLLALVTGRLSGWTAADQRLPRMRRDVDLDGVYLIRQTPACVAPWSGTNNHECECDQTECFGSSAICAQLSHTSLFFFFFFSLACSNLPRATPSPVLSQHAVAQH